MIANAVWAGVTAAKTNNQPPPTPTGLTVVLAAANQPPPIPTGLTVVLADNGTTQNFTYDGEQVFYDGQPIHY